MKVKNEMLTILVLQRLQREQAANENVHLPQLSRRGLYIEVVKLRTWWRRRVVIVL